MIYKQWLNTLLEEDFTNALYYHDDAIEYKCCAAYFPDTDCHHHHCREGFIARPKQEHKEDNND